MANSEQFPFTPLGLWPGDSTTSSFSPVHHEVLPISHYTDMVPSLVVAARPLHLHSKPPSHADIKTGIIPVARNAKSRMRSQPSPCAPETSPSPIQMKKNSQAPAGGYYLPSLQQPLNLRRPVARAALLDTGIPKLSCSLIGPGILVYLLFQSIGTRS